MPRITTSSLFSRPVSVWVTIACVGFAACSEGDAPGDVGDDLGTIDFDEDGYAADVDCNDEDAAIHPDADEDCSQTDRNCDGDATLGATDPVLWFVDADGDGVGVGEGTLRCAGEEGEVTGDGDCDDSLDTGAGCSDSCGTFYSDADSDGFGDDLDTVERCTAPTGYVAVSGDCDPDNGLCTEDCTDLDGDGACAAFDCDDSSETGSSCTTCDIFYRDADEDGAGDEMVSVEACIAPPGFVATFGDCDDTAETGGDCTNSCNTYYADADADGWGVAEEFVTACSAPAGYVAAFGDCAPANPLCRTDCTDADGDGACITHDCDDSADTGGSCYQGCGTFFADADSDGFGDPDNTTIACAAPADYVSNAADCYDGNINARPGQSQAFPVHRGDGSFDYNCDDEGLPEQSNIPGSCDVSGLTCDYTPGWVTTRPPCGMAGAWITGCTYDAFSCTDETSVVVTKCL